MKRRNFVKASVVGAGLLAVTPVTSIFAEDSASKKFAAGLDLPSLAPEVTKHYVQFSEDFFAGLPAQARNQSQFQDVILPAKTISYDHSSKEYNLTFLNRNGDAVSFIKRKSRNYTVIKAS